MWNFFIVNLYPFPPVQLSEDMAPPHTALTPLVVSTLPSSEGRKKEEGKPYAGGKTPNTWVNIPGTRPSAPTLHPSPSTGPPILYSQRGSFGRHFHRTRTRRHPLQPLGLRRDTFLPPAAAAAPLNQNRGVKKKISHAERRSDRHARGARKKTRSPGPEDFPRDGGGMERAAIFAKESELKKEGTPRVRR